MPQRPIEIHGYAIVSDDDMIADSHGEVPSSLRNEKDWTRYQAALAAADLVVFGRVSHQNEPNTRGDPRLVVSRGVRGLEKRAQAHWWNPADVGWPQVVSQLLPQGGNVAAPGGRAVFDLFLELGYDAFHLARAHGVKLPGGHRIFSECGERRSAEAVMESHGLKLTQIETLDAAAGVEMQHWRKA